MGDALRVAVFSTSRPNAAWYPEARGVASVSCVLGELLASGERKGCGDSAGPDSMAVK